jgi:hypothetical protein
MRNSGQRCQGKMWRMEMLVEIGQFLAIRWSMKVFAPIR